MVQKTYCLSYCLALLLHLFSVCAIGDSPLTICILSCRLAHALASSFNFQGQVKKIFYILSDDKIGSGPRLKPHSLSKPAISDPNTDQPMETDSAEAEGDSGNTESTKQPPKQLSLSSKLAAQTVKRKASEPAEAGNSKSRR